MSDNYDIPDRSVKNHALMVAYEDWLDPGSTLSIASEKALDDNEQRQLSIGVIAELLVEKLVVPGYMLPGWIHAPWDGSAGDAIARIAAEWSSDFADKTLFPGAIVWLAITDKGRSQAESILRAEGAL